MCAVHDSDSCLIAYYHSILGTWGSEDSKIVYDGRCEVSILLDGNMGITGVR